MQKQTGQKESVTLNTQSPAKETDKENSLTNNIPLENGFVIRRRDEKWFTTLGDTQITKPTDNYNGQLEQIDEINYELIVKIIIHVIRSMKQIDTIDRMTQAGL